jgi:hypothetical protein
LRPATHADGSAVVSATAKPVVSKTRGVVDLAKRDQAPVEERNMPAARPAASASASGSMRRSVAKPSVVARPSAPPAPEPERKPGKGRGASKMEADLHDLDDAAVGGGGTLTEAPKEEHEVYDAPVSSTVHREITDEDFDQLFEEHPPKPPSLLQRIGTALGFGGKVRATIVLERPDQLVLTFVTPKELDWSPGTTLDLHIGGRTIQVRLDPTATTANAKLAAGVTVRVTLILDAALPSGALELDVNGLRLTAQR